MGRTYYFSGHGDDIDGYQKYSETLVYYSNGQTRVGTPLEDLNGSKNIHYVPLPEECATWTRTVSYEGPPGSNSNIQFSEQISTGAKHPHNGFNYIEMMYTGGGDSASLIGYFYNDSVNRKAFYTTAIDSPAQVLCDFTALPGENCYSTDVVAVDSVLIGGQYRTRWSCSNDAYGENSAIIAGIGHLCGLMIVRIFYGLEASGYVELDGQLTCFSVCGQTLYPNDTVANCPVLTGLQQVNLNSVEIKLYPSVNDGRFMLSWVNSHTDDELLLFDLTGRLVGQYEINNTLTTCQANKLSKGMYLWRAVTNNVPVQQGKFIVE